METALTLSLNYILSVRLWTQSNQSAHNYNTLTINLTEMTMLCSNLLQNKIFYRFRLFDQET